MGVCLSLCGDKKDTIQGAAFESDVASLIQTERMNTELMMRSAVPPAPLLKEINFAAIADDDIGSDDSDTDLDDDEVEQLLNEEEDDQQ